MLMDSGANLDCRPEMLVQFGIMGSVYMQRVMGVSSPRVGVINVGTEETKGTENRFALRYRCSLLFKIQVTIAVRIS